MNIASRKKLAAGFSIISNAVIIILKFIAGILSGSISIISEAIHSLSDFLASILTFFAVSRSSEPADKDHPFGHGKYEDLSGFIEGCLIIFAAIYIIYEAGKKLIFGQNFEVETTLGIAVMLFAVITNYFVSTYLFNVAKSTNSVSLYADAQHLRTDIYSSVGVLIGLLLIKYTGIQILDPIIALLVAVIILKTGFSISKETLNNLLDGSLPIDDINQIEEIIKNYEGCVIGCKNIKGRRVGPEKDIELTLFFPKKMTIQECHNICDEIEDLIQHKLGSSSIIIHAEPEDCPKCKGISIYKEN